MNLSTAVIPKNASARERILLTAHTLFYRDGVRATGIDRVIAESKVAKVTFYRHFPSKNDLIREFLNYRHQRWMAWFESTLQHHGANIDALVPTLAQWFNDKNFRGCAFINSLGELNGLLPGIAQITREHKQDMTKAIARLLPKTQTHLAEAIALVVDGAIVRAQFEADPKATLVAVEQALQAWVKLR